MTDEKRLQKVVVSFLEKWSRKGSINTGTVTASYHIFRKGMKTMVDNTIFSQSILEQM